MIMLYGFWGFTTICLFWAAMIRATREWGGSEFQGRAFGWLEGGRGSVAALLATVAFFQFSQGGNFRAVILTTSGITFLSGWLVMTYIPKRNPEKSGAPLSETVRGVLGLLKMRNTWLLSIIVLCAYSGYKITDDFPLFVKEVLGFSEATAAGVGTAALWIRALVAILAGYIADLFNKTSLINVSFALCVIGSALIGLRILDGLTGMLLLNLALTAAGHSHVFLLLSSIAMVGLVAGLLFRKSARS